MFGGYVAYPPSGLFPSQSHSKSPLLCSALLQPASRYSKTLFYINFSLLFLVYNKCEKMLVLVAMVLEEFLMR